MPTCDEKSATCYIYTFKDGLLSQVAHDLRLRVGRFALRVEDEAVSATFDTASLAVDTAMRDGVATPNALGAGDKAKIAAQIREEVLHSAELPQASFQSSKVVRRADGGYDVTGALTLHGVTRTLVTRTQLVEGRQRLEVSLHQPDFGITPYRAMLGALKIRPDVRVELIM